MSPRLSRSVEPLGGSLSFRSVFSRWHNSSQKCSSSSSRKSSHPMGVLLSCSDDKFTPHRPVALVHDRSDIGIPAREKTLHVCCHHRAKVVVSPNAPHVTDDAFLTPSVSREGRYKFRD